jgi:acyl-CoA thioesterase I
VLHFHRQALMNRLVETHTAEMPELVAKDGLHMTALAHFCTGQLLARQIARASLMRRAEIQR